jgi:hypothetical protein
MTDRNKRTIRTIVQVVIALATAVPDVITKVPLGATAVQVVAVAGAVTHYFYLAERLPFFPPWLRLDTAVTATPITSSPVHSVGSQP